MGDKGKEGKRKRGKGRRPVYYYGKFITILVAHILRNQTLSKIILFFLLSSNSNI